MVVGVVALPAVRRRPLEPRLVEPRLEPHPRHRHAAAVAVAPYSDCHW